MNRTRNVSQSPDRLTRRELGAALAAVAMIAVIYLAAIAAMRVILALGWYAA